MVEVAAVRPVPLPLEPEVAAALLVLLPVLLQAALLVARLLPQLLYLLPLVLLLLPGLTVRRAVLASLFVLFGVFMMRWNVVIGGQAFSLTFDGFMHYRLPIIPHDMETFKEGLGGALMVITAPFVIFYFLNMLIPAFFEEGDEVHADAD